MTDRKTFPTFLTLSLLAHGVMMAFLGMYPWQQALPDKPLKVRILPEAALKVPAPGERVPAPPPVVQLPEAKAKPKLEIPKGQEPPKPPREEFPRSKDRSKPKIEDNEAPLDKSKVYTNLPTGEGGTGVGMGGKGVGLGDGKGKGMGSGKGEGSVARIAPQDLPPEIGNKQEAVRPGFGGTKDKSLRDSIASVDKYVDPKTLEKGSPGGLRGGGQGGRVSILNPNLRYSSYLAKFVDKVEGVFHYRSPEPIRKDGVALIKLLRNGQVAELKLLQSSGNRGFDEAALAALKIAAPYAPFPSKWEDEDLYIEVVFY